jgi:hypothetical protein
VNPPCNRKGEAGNPPAYNWRARALSRPKEVVGGYWMLQVKSKEEAIDWASRCPASDNEVIEVRQVQEFADFTPEVQEAASEFRELKAKSGERKWA